MSTNILWNDRERIHLSLLLFKCCFSAISFTFWCPSLTFFFVSYTRDTFRLRFTYKERKIDKAQKKNDIIIITAACVPYFSKSYVPYLKQSDTLLLLLRFFFLSHIFIFIVLFFFFFFFFFIFYTVVTIWVCLWTFYVKRMRKKWELISV